MAGTGRPPPFWAPDLVVAVGGETKRGSGGRCGSPGDHAKFGDGVGVSGLPSSRVAEGRHGGRPLPFGACSPGSVAAVGLGQWFEGEPISVQTLSRRVGKFRV